jgi:hypothetical protein
VIRLPDVGLGHDIGELDERDGLCDDDLASSASSIGGGVDVLPSMFATISTEQLWQLALRL